MKNRMEPVEYLGILWEKKWIIIFGTLLCMLTAGIVSLLLKPVWEVDAIIQPGKLLIENRAGNYREVVVESPRQIADKVNHGAFDYVIADELGLDWNDMPRVKGEEIQDTHLTRIWVRHHDAEQGKKILDSLIRLLENDINEKVLVEIHNIDSVIEENRIEKKRRENEVDILTRKQAIIKRREIDIAQKMKSAVTQIGRLEQEQSQILSEKQKSENEIFGLLLYSNEVVMGLGDYELLNEKLGQLRLTEEDIRSQLLMQISEIKKIENRIDSLTDKKGRLEKTKVIKAATASDDPVSPRVLTNVSVTGLLGMIFLTVLVYLIVYVENRRIKQ